MELLNTIAQQFLSDTNNDGNVNLQDVTGSLQNLMSGADGKLDLGSVVSKVQGMGLSDVASSWLGDGDNKPISNEQVGQMFDSDKLSQLASSLNMDVDSVKSGLSKAVPNLVDKASSGGSLLDLANLTNLVGGEGAGGLLGKVKKLFS